ncbi:nitroreductase [Bacillus sp. MRMR6]|uniref:nitroreductase family protein n=1 Tax=Bacillus sp. MRMR6 TaxID=1928617 RepID=UPI0009533C65|nr:nitroreductase [Bacillus sp. MRMR6]OLS39892.1 nitroreductase [Bacillus sp. MRMR6]
MDILSIMKSRRNIKKFKPNVLINVDLVRSWLEAASMAPNHRMTEPWEFHIVGTETREKLNHKSNFGDAPLVIAFLSRHGASNVETEENLAATACLIQNFNLAAWAEGVGTFWSSIGITEKNRKLLNVPDSYHLVGVLGIGYPEVIPDPKPRTPIENKIKTLP